jgi:hypothetical protein
LDTKYYNTFNFYVLSKKPQTPNYHGYIGKSHLANNLHNWKGENKTEENQVTFNCVFGHSVGSYADTITK